MIFTYHVINNCKLVHYQINANGPARCGLTNPQHRRKSGLDMAIQTEQGVACHINYDKHLHRDSRCGYKPHLPGMGNIKNYRFMF